MKCYCQWTIRVWIKACICVCVFLSTGFAKVGVGAMIGIPAGITVQIPVTSKQAFNLGGTYDFRSVHFFARAATKYVLLLLWYVYVAHSCLQTILDATMSFR